MKAFLPQVALIIGASSPLSISVARNLASSGVLVLGAGRTDPCDEAFSQFIPIEIQTADWKRVFETFTGIDLVIFVAGTAVFGRTPQIPVSEARSVFEVNFFALAEAARQFGAVCVSEKRSGRFLAILSISGRRAVPFEAWYCASKAAAARFLESLHLEFEPFGISFEAVYPGVFESGFRAGAPAYGVKSGSGERTVTMPAASVGRIVTDLALGRGGGKVIGMRERIIDLADRLFPGLYDAVVLRGRVNASYRDNQDS